MILLALSVPGLILGLVTGGRIKHIGTHPVRGLWLPVAAFAIKALAARLLPPQAGAVPVCAVQYALLFIFLVQNRRYLAFMLPAGLGTLMNALAILLNGGCMPVDLCALPQSAIATAKLAAGEIYAYMPITAATKLPFLGDVLAVAPLSGLIGLASIGDILLSLGAACLCYMLTKEPRKQAVKI